MKQLKCETCGSTLELNGDGLHAVCHTCGNVYEYRSPKEELAVQQMNEANDLRINMDFDEAIKKYRLVTKSNPEDAEGYWGLLLSKYGIAYECEPDTMKYVPTFHRNRRGNIREDASAQNALKYATPTQKETYEKALDELRYIQEGIEDFADNCDPYDVFISFKATEVGSDTKTIDRDIAYNIYDELNSRGIRTFFSEVSLRSMVAEDYEAVIFNALNTCRVFILVGTSKENIDSLWVKNEWTRYNERVADDRLNGLPQSSRFAVLGGTLKPSELPREFARTQNVMLSNYAGDSYKKDIAYSVEILLGIKKEEKKPAIDENDVKAMVDRLVNERVASNNSTVAQPRATAAPVTLENLTERIKMFIQNEDWENASEYVSRALDMSPHNSDIHHYKILADNKVHNVSDLATCPYIFEKLIVRSKPYLTADIAAKVDAALLERQRIADDKTSKEALVDAKIKESSALFNEEKDLKVQQDAISSRQWHICEEADDRLAIHKNPVLIVLSYLIYPIAIVIAMTEGRAPTDSERMVRLIGAIILGATLFSAANAGAQISSQQHKDVGRFFTVTAIGVFTLGVGVLIINIVALFQKKKAKAYCDEQHTYYNVIRGIIDGNVKDKSVCKDNENCLECFELMEARQQKNAKIAEIDNEIDAIRNTL